LTNGKDVGCRVLFNGAMCPAQPTDAQRAALLHFEAAYARWCAAAEALASAELRLWTEMLQGPGGENQAQLAAEVLRLRVESQTAYEAMLPLAPD
jgi:hypothetical protein